MHLDSVGVVTLLLQPTTQIADSNKPTHRILIDFPQMVLTMGQTVEKLNGVPLTPTGAIQMAKKPESEVGTPAESEGKITKTEMVRQAIKNDKSKPQEGIAWILENFGVELTPSLFSTVKFSLQKKAQTVTQTGTGSRTVTPPTPIPTSTNSPTTSGSPAQLAFEVKALIDSYGLEEVKRMVAAADMFLGVR